MQNRAVLVLTLTSALAACVPGSPIYFGPPLASLRGTVYNLETSGPIAHAEVCLLSADTTCVRANDGGNYQIQLQDEVVGTVRFRVSGVRPAIREEVHLVPGTVITVDCTMSMRSTLSSEPSQCRPAPGAPASAD